MTSLEDWLAALSDHLEVDLSPELIPLVLDLARDAAHSVLRPAAPLSTFIVGYAAGLASLNHAPDDAVRGTVEKVESARSFAIAWAAPGDGGD